MGWLDFFSGNKTDKLLPRRASTARHVAVQSPSTDTVAKRRVLGTQPPPSHTVGQSRSGSSGKTAPKAVTPLPTSSNRGTSSKKAAKAPPIAAKLPATLAKASRAMGKAGEIASTKRGSKTVVSPTGNRTSKTASGTDIMTTREGRTHFITKKKTAKGQKKTVHSYDKDALKKTAGQRTGSKRKS